MTRLGGAEPFPEPRCREGHLLTVARSQHFYAAPWEALCLFCYDVGSPHGHGLTPEEAVEDHATQEWEKYAAET